MAQVWLVGAFQSPDRSHCCVWNLARPAQWHQLWGPEALFLTSSNCGLQCGRGLWTSPVERNSELLSLVVEKRPKVEFLLSLTFHTFRMKSQPGTPVGGDLCHPAQGPASVFSKGQRGNTPGSVAMRLVTATQLSSP